MQEQKNPEIRSYGIHRFVDTLGRVVIPKDFRDALGMTCGSQVEVCRVDGGILIRPVKE